MHVVHTIANGSIEDKDGEDQKIGKKMSADAVVRRICGCITRSRVYGRMS